MKSLLNPVLVSIGLLITLVGTIQAQPREVSGFSFLRLDPAARAAAHGGIYSPIAPSEATSVFYNPAYLDSSAHRSTSISYLNYLSDINAGFLAYGREVSGVGTVAAGLRFLGWGEMEEADQDGNRMGSFGASDLALSVGVSRAYNRSIRYGGTVHVIYSHIAEYSASAVAADLGAVYRHPNGRFGVAVSANNLGITTGSFGAVRDKLPTDLRVTISRRLQNVPLLASISAYNLTDLKDYPEGSKTGDQIMSHIMLGGEFQFSEAFNVRFGYNHRRHQELAMKSRLDLAGISAGFGIRLRRFGFDYALNNWSSVGNLHQLTLHTRL